MRRVPLAELLTIGALLTCLATVAMATSRASKMRHAVDLASVAVSRTSVQDRLTGQVLDPGAIHGDAKGPPVPTVVWLLDLDRCIGCLDDIGGWRHLERAGDQSLLLVLTGTETPQTHRRLRLLQRTHVVRRDEAAIRMFAGPTLPSTKLLLDTLGTVLFVDSRVGGQACSWSFEDQVARLVGSPPRTAPIGG